ncbi:MAG: hypothetical protein WC386_02585 [Candidatus Paceibacterota bacterium]
MINFINKKLIIVLLFVFFISPILASADNLPSVTTLQNINTNIPEDALDSEGNPVTAEDLQTTPTTTDTIFTTTKIGDITLPAQQQIQGLTSAAESTPKSTSETTKTTNCNCNLAIFDFLCPLRCFIIDIFSQISQTAIRIGTVTLNFAIGSGSSANKFAGFGYNTTDNVIILAGWGVVRNVANAVLVLGLVIIAITIILGLQENKSKKLLITFILIALLINFTPVICEFIITGFNIITYSFLTGSGVSSDGYAFGISNAFTYLKNLDNNTNFGIQGASAMILLIFSIFFGIILILYAILFVARNIILWILIIFSPIAFATKVFPEFKHIKNLFPNILHWDDWWASFWQWCVIGIPAGLSIYLANEMMGILTNVIASDKKSTLNMAALSGDPINAILSFCLAFSVPFIFLLVGLFISISTGTKAAGKLSGELTGFGKKALGFAGGAALGVAGGVAGGAVGAARAAGRGDNIGSAAREGYSTGKETAQKEGVFGSTMIAAGHIGGAGIGVVGGLAKGTKNWAIRQTDDYKETVSGGLEQKRDDEISKIRGAAITAGNPNPEATKKAVDYVKEKYNKKIEYNKGIQDSGGMLKNVVEESATGFNEGAGKTTAKVGSTIFGAMVGGVVGAANTNRGESLASNIISGGTQGADIGRRTIGKAGEIAAQKISESVKDAGKTLSGAMTEPLVGKSKSQKVKDAAVEALSDEDIEREAKERGINV